jgi:hypothetical protein
VSARIVAGAEASKTAAIRPVGVDLKNALNIYCSWEIAESHEHGTSSSSGLVARHVPSFAASLTGYFRAEAASLRQALPLSSAT